MKNQLRTDLTSNTLCHQHNEKCTFVCLHKTCLHAFKIGCSKCRKDHGQHPNRLISIADFHTMLAKPIRYIQNSTGFKLMNLKKKNEYIRNFRTSILQKEILLIESNKNIKSTIAAILQQHYYIRDIVSHLTPEKLTQNYQQYIEYLSKSKEFLAFNPVKGDLVFNNEVIKTGRINLEKYIKTSHDLIDNVREFLVKIIQVLIAHCAYEEDDDDIQIDEQGDNATNFNIFIKTRINVIENPNIKSKLEHQTFLQMFDQQKDSLNKEIQLLQKQLDVKVQILRKIKYNNSKPQQRKASEQNIQSQLEKQISISNHESKQKYYEEQSEQFCKQTQQSARGIENLNNRIIQLRQEYETIIANKEQYIQELKHMCSNLEQKINQCEKSQDDSDKEKIVSRAIYLEIKQNLQKQINFNNQLKDKIKELEKKQFELNQKNQQLDQFLDKTKKQMQSLRQDYQNRILQLQKNIDKEISEKNKKQNQLIKVGEEIQKKQKQVSRQRKKYIELQKMVDKMRQNSASSEKQLLKWRDQHQIRQKRLRIQLEGSQKELQNLHYKIKIDSQKIKHLQTLAKQHNKTIDKTSNQLRQKEKQLKSKDELYKQKYQITTSRIKQLEIQLKNSQSTESTLKSFESQSKKFKEMKEMLEISIKKNQELKDKNFKLQSQIQQYRHQLKSVMKNNYNETIKDNRKSFCLDEISRSRLKNFENQVSEEQKFDTLNSKEVNFSSRTPKKRDSQMVLKDRKIVTNKKQAYLQIKSIFKAVTEDMGLLQQRLKENNVVEKVYLKQLQRKRLQNKTLKKQLQSIKLYGGTSKPQQNQQYQTTSPISKGIDKQFNIQNNINVGSPLSKKTQSQSGLGRKISKITK